MKLSSRIIAVVFIALATVLTSASKSHALWARDAPTGEPPYGLAIQQDAQGVKLSGVVVLEYYNIRDESPIVADIRVAVRLRQGKKFATFYGEARGVNASAPREAQDAITATVAADILEYFFQGQQGLTIALKSLTEGGEVEACVVEKFSNCFDDTTFRRNAIVIADIVLAVN